MGGRKVLGLRIQTPDIAVEVRIIRKQSPGFLIVLLCLRQLSGELLDKAKQVERLAILRVLTDQLLVFGQDGVRITPLNAYNDLDFFQQIRLYDFDFGFSQRAYD